MIMIPKKTFFLSVILVLVVLFLVMIPFVLKSLCCYLYQDSPLMMADIGIVLSGDTDGRRVLEAVDLYKEHHIKKILMTVIRCRITIIIFSPNDDYAKSLRK